MPPPRKTITGRRTGRLVATRFAGADAKGRSLWYFLCDCGSEVVRIPSNMGGGPVPSCGCWRRETASQRGRNAVQKGTKTHDCQGCDGQFRHTVSTHRFCKDCRKIALLIRNSGVKITVKEYRHALQEADGFCQSCGVATERLECDHDHVTGAFRGMICHPCNHTEGYFKDDYTRLLRLYEYCVKHQEAARV